MPSVAGLFVGCGGLDLGFKHAGFNLTWANDIEVDACKTYKKFVHSSVVFGDIWDLIDQVPPVDVIIGGPPCQAFSLVGKRAEDDPRAKLVSSFVQVIERNRPQAFVMENVPGLAASKVNGKRLPNLLAERFVELGYSVELLKLHAVDFFVPQKRVRIVIVGMKRGSNMKQFSLLHPEEFAHILGEPSLQAPVNTKDALGDLPVPLPAKNYGYSYYEAAPKSAYARVMRRNACDKVSLQVMPTMSEKDREFVRHIPPGGNYMNVPDDVATKRILNFKKTGGRTTTYGRLHPERPSYTVNTYFNRPNVGTNYHYEQERLITPREALRLQSFSDDFEPEFSSQRSLHMQIGNAVPPLMARGIAESLKKAMGC